MKKIILTLFALATFATCASAQLYVGGSANFSINAYNGGTSVGFGLSPEVGYMFNDKIGVGGYLNLGINGSSGSTAFGMRLAPYFRYAFAQVGKVKFFGDAIVPLGVQDSAFAWGIDIAPGIIVNLGGRWDLVSHIITLGYNGLAGNGGSSGVFQFNILSGPSLGVFYTF